jgi:protein-tyrosine phosphatase
MGICQRFESATMSQPPRSLNLAGATNFRDLGGYQGRDGRIVRWRRLFRSDHLAGLSASDRAELARLGLRRSFDFRGVTERAVTAYDLPGVSQHSLPIEPTVVQSLAALRDAGRRITPEHAVDAMRETYLGFVRHGGQRFGTLLRHLADDDAPAVFHCTAGKDRTGFAAALLLSALGVSREAIMDDFLLTNALYRREPGASHTDLPQDVLEVLWRVQAGFLEAALQALEREHGGVEGYLAAIGIGPAERERLVAHYLEG